MGLLLTLGMLVRGGYHRASPLNPVLLKLRPQQGLLEIREALNYLFDLGAFFAFFWFLFRATEAGPCRRFFAASARSNSRVRSRTT